MATSNKKGNGGDSITIDLQPFIIPLSVILGSIIIAGSIHFGLGNIGAGTTLGATDPAVPVEEANVPQEPEFPEAIGVLGDDAYIGNKEKAKIAIIEYSDYECPFCKRHVDQTVPKLLSEYVEKGGVIYVYKDFPLSFHDPNAIEQAQAAECVRDLSGGDNAVFFKFHDLIYETTTSNKGLTSDQLFNLASKVSIKTEDLKNCVSSEKFLKEVQGDVAEGKAAGVTGTPGFIIGRIQDDGSVVGKRIDGAYPYESFVEILSEYL